MIQGDRYRSSARKNNLSTSSLNHNVIRIKVYPTVCKTSDRKQIVEDWGKMEVHMSRQELSTLAAPVAPSLPEGLLEELRQLIDETRGFIASTVNSALTMAFWRVGDRIRKVILQEERAGYGLEIVVTLSRQLVVDYGKSFTDKNLRRMIQFSEMFPDDQIVVTLSRQLSWSHFVALLPIKDCIKRDFYAEMCRIEKWNVRTLRKKIDSMLFERTALSKKPSL